MIQKLIPMAKQRPMVIKRILTQQRRQRKRSQKPVKQLPAIIRRQTTIISKTATIQKQWQ
ncbi:hypothetical protein ATX67_10095 [Oenococcus oeni]|nr:hypothetical protein ATX67_10095 [Oenococcus oeni]